MYLTPIIPRCIGQPRQQPSHPTNVTHVPRAASIIDQATATSELSSVQALLTDVHVAVDTGTLPATHNASMPGLDQQPSTLSRAQLVHAIWLAGVLTQREPSFAHAHAGAVGSLLVLLEQRAGGEGEGLRARQALKLLAALDIMLSTAAPQHRNSKKHKPTTTNSSTTRQQLLTNMQLLAPHHHTDQHHTDHHHNTPTTTSSTVTTSTSKINKLQANTLPLRLEALVLHAVTECDGEQLAAMQGHIQRLGFTATMRLKEAQAARLMQLLGEYVVGDGDDVVVGGGGAGKKSVEATRGDSADDTQHTLSSTTEASQRSQTKPHITIDDVIRVLSGFTAGSTTPTKPTTFMDDHLNVALPHLIQHANGKNIADLLREVVVLKVQLSVEVQHVLGGAITKHVGEMGAASMSKVVSALSTRRHIAAAVDTTALCAHLMTQLSYFTPRALALTLVNLVTIGPLPPTMDLEVYGQLFSKRVHQMQPGEVCNVLKVFGQLRATPSSVDAQQVGAALAPHLNTLHPRQLVPALTFFAALGHIPASVCPVQLGDRVGSSLPQLQVPGLVVLSWMLIRVGSLPQGVPPAQFCTALGSRLAEMGPSEVATAAEALSVLGTLGNVPVDAPVRQMLAAAITRVLPTMTTTADVVRVTQALFSLQLDSVRPQVVAAAVSKACGRVEGPGQLSRLLVSAVRVAGVAGMLDVGMVGKGLQAHLGQAEGRVLARMLWVLTKMESTPPSLNLTPQMPTLLNTIPTLPPRDRTRALWAIARLMQRGDLHRQAAWPCVASLAHAITSDTDMLNADDLCMSLHAVSMLPSLPEELDMETLAEAAVGSLGSLNIRQLSQALATFSGLRWDQWPRAVVLEEWEAAMVARIDQSMGGGRGSDRVDGEVVGCGVLAEGMGLRSGEYVCACADTSGRQAVHSDVQGTAVACVECLAAFAAQRYRPSPCTLARILPVVCTALPQHPLLAAHCLTALAKLRVVLPVSLTGVLWDAMLQHLKHNTPRSGRGGVVGRKRNKTKHNSGGGGVIVGEETAMVVDQSHSDEEDSYEEQQQHTPSAAAAPLPIKKQHTFPFTNNPIQVPRGTLKHDTSEVPAALRSALWALCVMYADDPHSLAALLPRAQRAAALLDSYPPTSLTIAKQLLLVRAVFLSVCDDGSEEGGVCAAPVSMVGDDDDDGNDGGWDAAGRASNPAAMPRPPQRPALRCDSPAELFSEDMLRACRDMWDAGARTPVPSTVQRQLATTAGLMPDLVVDVQQGVEYLEGGLLRGNLGCRLVSTGQLLVLCPTRPGRVLGGGREDGAPLLDGPMALRFALLRWEGLVPVAVPQREWEMLEDEVARVEYLRRLVVQELH